MNRVPRESLFKYLCTLQMEIFLSYYKAYSQTASSKQSTGNEIQIGNLTWNEVNFSALSFISCFWTVPWILIFKTFTSISDKESFFL